jgi:Ca2+-binding RTX toxin-like protein
MSTFAQPTPTEPRTYITPEASGTATGTGGPDDIYATGAGQTLIGNGGDDIFHIGTNTDAKIVENAPGISTVDTWAGAYTLVDGVDNLSASGDYAHSLAGNAEANVITGAGGNDTIVGGKADWLIGGGGQDTFVVTNGDAADAIRDMQAGPGGDVVRLVNTGWTTFAEVKAHMTDLPTQGDSDPSLAGTLKHSSQLVLPSGERLNFTDVSMNQLTADNFAFDNSGAAPTPSPSPAPAPTPTPPPAGTDVLVLHVSEDAWNGDAQFTVTIDGVSPAHVGVLTATTPHSSGTFEDFTFTGTFGDHPHTIAINFVNDAWGGTASTDRNLYVGGIEFNGVHYAGQTAQNNADGGQPNFDPNAAEMLVNGTVTFTNVAGGASPTPSPSPSPGPTPAPTGQTITGTSGDDILTGTAGNDTINALAGNDALAGLSGADALNGGDGFDLANYAASPAAVTIDLGAGTASGGDADGDVLTGIEAVRGSAFGDVITGDAGPNLLESGGGNDVIHGGAGNDILISGDRGTEITPTLTTFTGGELFPSHMDGATLLDGGPGNDTLIGGANTTYFIHAGNGSDGIFNYAGGIVDIDGYAIGDVATLKAHATAGFGFIDVDLGNGEALHFGFGPHPGERSVAELDHMRFSFTNVQASPSPGPGPSPTPSAEGPTPTPIESRAYLTPDGTGTAHGTAAAEDIFATGDGQTLIGGGGDDIFHVGTYTGLSIQETNPGISAVDTWGNFTLVDGIDNLSASGGYGHTLTGNDGNNVITGAAGNDLINGHGGTDLLLGGGGADTFVVDEVRRFEILSRDAPHIGDFDPATDHVDLHLYLQAAGISDADPFATHKIGLQANAAGGTDVVDNTQNISAGGAPIPVPIITLDHVAPSGLHETNFILA